MKRLKFAAFMAVLALGLVSAFAFNTKPVKTATTEYTYYFIGDPAELSDVQDPAMWVTSGTPCNPSGAQVCSIKSTLNQADFNTHVAAFPSISQALSECDTRRN